MLLDSFANLKLDYYTKGLSYPLIEQNHTTCRQIAHFMKALKNEIWTQRHLPLRQRKKIQAVLSEN